LIGGLPWLAKIFGYNPNEHVHADDMKGAEGAEEAKEEDEEDVMEDKTGKRGAMPGATLERTRSRSKVKQPDNDVSPRRPYYDASADPDDVQLEITTAEGKTMKTVLAATETIVRVKEEVERKLGLTPREVHLFSTHEAFEEELTWEAVGILREGKGEKVLLSLMVDQVFLVKAFQESVDSERGRNYRNNLPKLRQYFFNKSNASQVFAFAFFWVSAHIYPDCGNW
jgi:hypothetical protein